MLAHSMSIANWCDTSHGAARRGTRLLTPFKQALFALA
jgi:hypothetical protein